MMKIYLLKEKYEAQKANDGAALAAALPRCTAQRNEQGLRQA
jgi:hypothetical protein